MKLTSFTLAALLVAPLVAIPATDVTGRFEVRTFHSSLVELPYRLLKPKGFDPKKSYPLVIFFHGAGERGTDNVAQLKNAVKAFASDDIMTKYPCFVIAPQCPQNQQWVNTPWTAPEHTMPVNPSQSMAAAFELLDAIRNEFPIDPARIYVTGISMGGFGTWDALQRHPELFAAGVPVCGGGDTALAPRLARMPLWVFHGGKDGVVKTKRSQDMVAALKAAGGQPKYDEYPGVDHWCWDRVYATKELYEWLFAQHRSLPPPAGFKLPSQAPAIPPAEGVLQYVNILQGTDSGISANVEDQSYGNCLPLVSAPLAMLDWSLQTKGNAMELDFFRYKNPRMLGFRATRKPSPFRSDYGACLITPQSGPLETNPARIGSAYDLKTSVLRPDYMRVDMPDSQIVAELTASERCGVMRFTFASTKEGRLLVDPGEAFMIEETRGRTFRGKTSKVKTYFVGVLDRDIARSGFYSSGACAAHGKQPVNAARTGAYLEFDVAQNPVVELRFAESFISFEQAEQNLKAETQGGFEAVRARTAAQWLGYLDRISIEGTEEQKKTFYTCLYRALKYPHRLHEVTAEGKTVHQSPWNWKLNDGVAFTDTGLWDTYRTQFPLFSIVYPELLGEIVQGWLNAFQEAGRLPQWPNYGGVTGMPGTHADAMIADAIVKGIPGFDVNKAYEAIRHDAFDPKARAGQEDYLKLGYVPYRSTEYWVSTSLDYAYDDWCVAQAARLLGKDDDYRQLMERAQNYRKLWDPKVGFMRGKKADGTWDSAKFDEFAWGGAYCEGGPWQASWAVQHDTAGLADLLGGRDALAKKLDTMVSLEPVFHPHEDGYRGMIHEMVEMKTLDMGQLAMCNQPAFHHPYMYSSAGQPWKGEALTRKVCDEKINAGPKGYPGDEDNGSMGSWYVLSALGFYPMTPGHPSYVLTSPALTKATLHLPGGKTFVVSAPGNNAKAVYVQKRIINGKEDTKTWISHETIISGGTMTVELGDKPHERTVKEDELPYSASEKQTQPTLERKLQ